MKRGLTVALLVAGEAGLSNRRGSARPVIRARDTRPRQGVASRDHLLHRKPGALLDLAEWRRVQWRPRAAHELYAVCNSTERRAIDLKIHVHVHVRDSSPAHGGSRIAG